LFTGLATQVIYGGCDADTADFYSKASGTATTDANSDDPNSHLRQRPLLTVDEVITPQVGNCTIFARYVEAGFATQVILNARLTRFYEREDWTRRLATADAIEPLLLERGVVLDSADQLSNGDITGPSEDAPLSTLERAVQARLAHKGDLRMRGVKTVPIAQLRERHQAKRSEMEP
jgi:hypothetical protein